MYCIITDLSSEHLFNIVHVQCFLGGAGGPQQPVCSPVRVRVLTRKSPGLGSSSSRKSLQSSAKLHRRSPVQRRADGDRKTVHYTAKPAPKLV